MCSALSVAEIVALKALSRHLDVPGGIRILDRDKLRANLSD
jgi:hypothetical protein